MIDFKSNNIILLYYIIIIQIDQNTMLLIIG